MAGWAGMLPAQDNAEKSPASLQLEGDPFAEEIRLIEAAADKAARQSAFEATLRRAETLKRDPDPLLSILRNKKPEDTFGDLAAWIRDHEHARRECFLPVLITAAGEAGDSARPALQALRAYGLAGADALVKLLAGENATDRATAVAVAGSRIGGLRGAARVIPHLVGLVHDNGSELQGAGIAALKRLALLNLETPAEWKVWLGAKSETDLMAEIGDRETEARRAAETRAAELERELHATLLQTMRTRDAQDAAALVNHLRNSKYNVVREEAARLLGALLPSLDEDGARAPIEALGGVLNDVAAADSVRRACAVALAEPRGSGPAGAAKVALAFAQIDRALESNGISADLKLELVKGLNSPIAAPRLARVLSAEIDVAATRSGALLETAIGQVRYVLETDDTGPNRDLLLAQLARLLNLLADQLSGTLEAPARKRFVDLATRANDTLQFLARLRRVDVSACVNALFRLIRTESGASNSALTALRQALDVPSAREPLRSLLTTPPESEQLAALYARLLADPGAEAMLVNLLGLCEALELAPEPVETIKGRLIERARSVDAVLPPTPEQRRNLRDALRGLLARLYSTPQEHVDLIQQLMDCDYGEKDALGYILVLRPSRVSIIAKALEPKLAVKPLRVGRLAVELASALTRAESESPAFAQFRATVNASVRADLGARVERGIRQGLDDEERRKLEEHANGPLRDQYVLAALEKLAANTAQSDNRDAMAEMLLAVLRKAHPEKYDRVALKGLDAAAFANALDGLKTRLKQDGYLP
jgi:hypothetical protein